MYIELLLCLLRRSKERHLDLRGEVAGQLKHPEQMLLCDNPLTLIDKTITTIINSEFLIVSVPRFNLL